MTDKSDLRERSASDARGIVEAWMGAHPEYAKIIQYRHAKELWTALAAPRAASTVEVDLLKLINAHAKAAIEARMAVGEPDIDEKLAAQRAVWEQIKAALAQASPRAEVDPEWVMALLIALEPFAKAFHDTGDTSTDHWQLNQHTGLTYGDLRRAAGALAAPRAASTKEQIRADRARFSDAAQKMGPK